MAKASQSDRVVFRINPPKGEPPNAAVYYEGVGRVITDWGVFETTWENLMDGMLGLPASEVALPKSILTVPTSFDKRCEFWKNLFTSVPSFIPHQEHACLILKRAKDAFLVRSVFGHSAFSKFIKSDPLTASFVNRRHKGGKVIQIVYEVSLPQLLETLNVIGWLRLALVPLLLHQISLQPPQTVGEKPHKRFGERKRRRMQPRH
jgi:hypothetical protein